MRRFDRHFLAAPPDHRVAETFPTRPPSVRGPSKTRTAPTMRRGLTLVEMLVAVTISLMVILAIVQVFQLLGTNIKNGQALIDVTTELRFIGQQLQDDLDGSTCPARTWIDPAAGLGYTEIYDGPSRDANWNDDAIIDARVVNGVTQDTSMGDVDDFIALTTRRTANPFVGRAPNVTGSVPYYSQVDSPVAEVIWWTAVMDLNNDGQLDANADGIPDMTDSIMLFRRELLVVPDIDLNPDDPTRKGFPANNIDEVLAFLAAFDISVRWVDELDGSGNIGRDGRRDTLLPNSLGDLTNRENRFLHLNPDDVAEAPELSGFPFPFASVLGQFNQFVRYPFSVPWLAPTDGDTKAQLDSALMAHAARSDNILAFDIRCYDPDAPLFVHPDQPNIVIAPGDPAYPVPIDPSNPNPVLGAYGRGAYVDLDYANKGSQDIATATDIDGDGIDDIVSHFGAPSYWPPVPILIRAMPFYDVWSTAYERDGVDQELDGNIDEGTNGIDDDGREGVDDMGERETRPPYDVPLRGVKITVRKMDYETRQTRQISVVGDFVPE